MTKGLLGDSANGCTRPVSSHVALDQMRLDVAWCTVMDDAPVTCGLPYRLTRRRARSRGHTLPGEVGQSILISVDDG